MTVFVSVRTGQHDEKWLRLCRRRDRPARSTGVSPHEGGDIDYLLKVVTTDIKGYDTFYKKLIKAVQLTGVSSAFSMEQIKCSTELPLELIAHGLPA